MNTVNGTPADPCTARMVYVGGPYDGEERRCAPVPSWPLSRGSIKGADGLRNWYDLDVTTSTAERAVYRFVGRHA